MNASGWASSLAWGFTLSFVAPVAGWAHGDLHGQIAAMTQRIEREPVNAEWRFRRGELRRLHGEWAEAGADFDKAAELDPRLEGVEVARCRLLIDRGALKQARAALDSFLAGHGGHAEALCTRARVLVRLGEPAAAVADFTRAIAVSASPEPDLYLERAAALVASGSDHAGSALRSLDEGIARLGSLVTLELKAIELELRLARFDAALARLDRLAARSPRKETWLARRGEVLEKAGRAEEARAAFTAALAALEALPPRAKETKSMADLRARVLAKLRP